ncbi:DUF6328 family protein [Streptomyces griseus]|uniref:DUF6328 family protein n=1 Tax=Streptomyces griseus TaxID=1911 RepID=UPI0038644031
MLGSRRSRAPGPFQPRFADLSTTDDRTAWVVAAARGPATVAALIAFVSFRRLLSGRQLKLQAGVRASRPAVLGPALLLRTMRSALPLVLRVALADTVALWLVRPIAHPRVVPGLLRVPGLRHGSYDGRTRLVRGPVSRRSCKGKEDPPLRGARKSSLLVQSPRKVPGTPSHPTSTRICAGQKGCDVATSAGFQMSRKRPASAVTCRDER